MHKLIHYLLLSCFIIPILSEAKDYKKLGIPTGSSTGTYIKFGNDIKEIVEEKHKEEIEVWVRESQGSVANVELLATKGENAALAIVQSDVVGYLRKSKDKKDREYARNLRLIFPFYNEEVHLLGKKEFKSITDLNGKKVIVGQLGSGTSLTAWNLLNLMGVKPKEFINATDDEAIDMVVSGKADAMFSVSGKPVEIFTTLSKMANEKAYKDDVAKVHFISLDDKIMLSEYVEGELTPNDYNMLKKNVPTVAVKAVLVAFDFSAGDTDYYKTRCSQLRKVSDAIRDNIEDLKKNKHPKWKEVNLTANLNGWQKDKCSHDSVPENSTKPSTSFRCRINPNGKDCK